MFFHVFLLPPPSLSPLPYPYNVMFFKTLTKMKIKTSKRPIRQEKPKQSKRKEKIHKNTTEFLFYVGQVLLGLGPGPGVWLICPVTFSWRKLIFPLPTDISCRELLGFLVSGRSWCLLLPVSARTLPGLVIHACVHMCMNPVKTVFLECLHLWLLLFFCLFHIDP